MTIEFICPNGHQLSAPENMAGKAGKCPRCGTRFLIPTLEELHAEEPEEIEEAAEPVSVGSATGSALKGAGSTPSAAGGSSPSAASKSGPSKSTVSVSPDSAAASSELGRAPQLPAGYFIFLCPNNHKLNGPVSLKGKPGQCPHCGAKFRIPADDEPEAPAPLSSVGVGVSSAVAVESSSSLPTAPAPEITEQEPDEIPTAEPISVWHLPPPTAGTGHALASLFGWIWAQREPQAVIELTLKDGEPFLPKWFAPELSSEGFGAFAQQDDSGDYSLTLLPWESIQSVVVRNLSEIPPQFE